MTAMTIDRTRLEGLLEDEIAAREITGRPKVLVFSYCYHGSVDEALAERAVARRRPRRAGGGPHRGGLRPRDRALAQAGGHVLHLYALNRGVPITPYHTMALCSPATPPEVADRHTEVSRARLTRC
jgi:glutamate-1-semialdehyde aminotransferase